MSIGRRELILPVLAIGLIDVVPAFAAADEDAVAKSVEAVDGLFTASGGRAIFLNSPMLRFFLDVHAARAHYANNPEKPARNLGAIQLKLKNTDFFI